MTRRDGRRAADAAGFGVRAARALGAALLVAAGASDVTVATAQEEEAREPEPADAHVYDSPDLAFELSLGGDGLALGYRNAFHRGAGYGALGFFVNHDDDVALHGRFMRFGEPFSETPLAFGVGLGVLVAFVDEPDAELAAAQVIGAAEYALALEYPVRFLLEAAYSPDIATFAEGNRTLDVVARAEVDLSSWATGFGGYRLLEIDIEDEKDVELDSAVHLGVRLGF